MLRGKRHGYAERAGDVAHAELFLGEEAAEYKATLWIAERAEYNRQTLIVVREQLLELLYFFWIQHTL